MTGKVQVVVTQPYVPAYRVPLFESLRTLLSAHEVDLTVYAASPRGDQAARGDQADAAWQRRLKTRSIRIGGRGIDFRVLPAGAASADVVVTELAVGNVLGWRRLLARKPTVLWGHGAPYTTKASRLGDVLKVLMVKLADHSMTYTEGGAAHLNAMGAPRDKVTAIGNSTDTRTLRSAITALRDAFDQGSEATTALFIGGLDSSKRIDFVLEAVQHALTLDPSFRLVMVGRGPLDAAATAEANRHGAIRIIPEARGRELAEIASAADMIWMPGRVGLIAVDAIALGLPVHTVRHDSHAPEIELLRADEIRYLPDDAREFARLSLQNAGKLPLRSDYPTIESVASNMAQTILRVVSDRVIPGKAKR